MSNHRLNIFDNWSEHITSKTNLLNIGLYKQQLARLTELEILLLMVRRTSNHMNLSDQEITQHIRRVLECGDNEASESHAIQSVRTLKDAVENWETNHGSDLEEPHEILRIQNFLSFLSGKPTAYTNDPWIVVSQILANFKTSTSEAIDMMPIIHGISLAADWQGSPGNEPDWLIELDQLLLKYHYEDFFNSFDDSGEEFSEFKQLSIRDRASVVRSVYFG